MTESTTLESQVEVDGITVAGATEAFDGVHDVALPDIVVADTRSLMVRVVDSRDRKPIGDAHVTVAGALAPSLGQPGQEAFTRSDGTAEIAVVSDQSANLQISHPSFAPATRTVGASDSRVTVALESGATVSGTVLAADGGPVAQAYVLIADGASIHRAACDSSGAYAIAGLAPGHYQVRLYGPEMRIYDMLEMRDLQMARAHLESWSPQQEREVEIVGATDARVDFRLAPPPVEEEGEEEEPSP
jgi:hypothetical protein